VVIADEDSYVRHVCSLWLKDILLRHGKYKGRELILKMGNIP